MEPGFQSTSAQLRWPRSDGTPDFWPEEKGRRDGREPWYAKVSYDNHKMQAYRKKLGNYLANEVLNIKGGELTDLGATDSSGQLVDGLSKGLPAVLPLSAYKRRQHPRRLLLGSRNANRFRSWPEFAPHAKWLMDTSLPLDDHSRCECKYNKTSAIAVEKRQHVQKRALEDEKTDPSKRARTDSKDDAMVVVERAIDERTKRRFRKGELVFFRIETISPPKGSGLPEITHWPGLISNIVEKSLHNGQEAEASVSAAWTLFGAQAPESLQKSSARKVWSHSIRALGMFSNTVEIHNKATSDILPWAAGVELYGGLEGWGKIAAEGERTLDEGVKREAKADPPKQEDLVGSELEARWRRRWGERIKFEQLPQSWDAVVLRLSVGLDVGQSIASSWSQTDKVSVLPPASTLTPEDVEALNNNRKTLFQGLWLRGERIWLDDMVMLRKKRTEIPVTDVLLGPSPGAEQRAVFLHIRSIALEVSSEVPDGSQAAQAGESNSRQAWRCVFYGDLYELASGEAPTEGAKERRVINTKAPKGFHYRSIHVDSSEVMLDVFDIAGRCYPDLFETESAYFYSPNDPNKAGRVEAGDTVLSLVGLRPCPTTHAVATTWKEDLYVIVRDATSEKERDARNSYAEKLCNELHYPVPDLNAKPRANGANGASNGNGAAK